MPTVDIGDADPVTVAEDGATITNGTWTYDTGADTDGAVTSVWIGTTQYAIDSDIILPEGTLHVTDNGAGTGTWSFDPNTNQNHTNSDPSVTFTVRLTDGDLDIATDSHTITITDGEGPTYPAAEGEFLVVDEAAITDTHTINTVGFTAGSDDLTSFAFSTDLSNLVLDVDGDTVNDVVWDRVDGSTITGSVDGTVAITLTMTDPGTILAGASGNASVSAVLTDAFPHPAAGGTNNISLGYVEIIATDIDGDEAVAPVYVDVIDDVPVFSLVNDGTDGDSIVSIQAPNPGVDTTYDGQFADWNPGADGFADANLTLPTNVEFVSKNADQIVLNLMEGADVAGTLTLNADGTDLLQVFHRDSETQFLPIANTSADAGGPTGTYLVELADAADFNIAVTGDDGVSPTGTAGDQVNTSSQGWGVKGNSGQTVDGNESLLFKFVDDGDNTTAYGVDDFKFQASGFTGGLKSADITIVVWLNATGTIIDTISISTPADQVVQISEITTDFTSATWANGLYASGDSIYATQITSNETGGGGFRINGIEIGEQSEIQPNDLDFSGIIVEIEDGDGDTVAQEFSVHIDGEDPYSGQLVVEIAPQLGTSGDDSLTFDSADNHIDGKEGYDTLLVDDTGALDFSSVHNVEKINLNDTGVIQNVTLSLNDVLNMTDSNNVLEITGGTEDTVTLTGIGTGTGDWEQSLITDGLFTQVGTGAEITIVNPDDNVIIVPEIDV